MSQATTQHGAGPCLYDLQQDPNQTTNVIDAHADLAADLRSILADRLQQQLPEIAPAVA